MISFFQKPVREINSNDILQLTRERFPEGFDLEYKETIPEKSGQPAAWVSGKDEVSAWARDKILAELIAFANAQGGYLILGISETREKPPRAETLVPLPRIGELARRLEDQARACIEPPIPRLEFHPVESTAGAGSLVIYCAASNSAPHRNSVNNEAFVRRGTSSVRMTMLEIQEMAVDVSRGLDRLPQFFGKRQQAFYKWVGSEETAAFRVTGIPMRKFPDPGRLFGRLNKDVLSKKYRAQFGGKASDIRLVVEISDSRPVLRGVRFSSDRRNGAALTAHLFQDGIVDIWFTNPYLDSRRRSELDEMYLYHQWVLGGVAVTLELIDQLRSIAVVPIAEYALEVEIGSFNSSDGDPYLTRHSLQYRGPFLDNFGSDIHLVEDVPIIVSDIPVESRSSFDEVITRVDTEIFDALGARTNPRTVTVEWNGY